MVSRGIAYSTGQLRKFLLEWYILVNRVFVIPHLVDLTLASGTQMVVVPALRPVNEPGKRPAAVNTPKLPGRDAPLLGPPLLLFAHTPRPLFLILTPPPREVTSNFRRLEPGRLIYTNRAKIPGKNFWELCERGWDSFYTKSQSPIARSPAVGGSPYSRKTERPNYL